MDPESDTTDAKRVTLAALVARGMRKFRYTYDMGDGWRHSITVKSVGPGEPDLGYPRLVDGQRRCPPEDIGGVPGFETFLDAIVELAHEGHGELREWYDGSYDPDDMDEHAVRSVIAAFATRRHSGKRTDP